MAKRHVKVGGGVDVDVAVAAGGGDHGHPAVLDEQLLELVAAARDDHVDQSFHGDELEQRLARTGDEGDRLGRQAGLEDRALHDLGQHAVGVLGGAAAAQHDGVARLQAEGRGVDRHVRPRLVDDGHHAERHPQAGELEPVGQPPAVLDLADRIGQGGDVAHAAGDLAQTVLVQVEAVDQRGVQLGRAREGHVFGVLGEDLAGSPAQGLGDQIESRVLARRATARPVCAPRHAPCEAAPRSSSRLLVDQHQMVAMHDLLV